jgi:fucose permease
MYQKSMIESMNMISIAQPFLKMVVYVILRAVVKEMLNNEQTPN